MAGLALDQLAAGMEHREVVRFDAERMNRFIAFTEDTAGIHTDVSFSRSLGYEREVVHGFALATVFSRILGMELPGEQTVIATMDLEFHVPVYLGDVVECIVRVERVVRPLRAVMLRLEIVKVGRGEKCVTGRSRCVFPAKRG